MLYKVNITFKLGMTYCCNLIGNGRMSSRTVWVLGEPVLKPPSIKQTVQQIYSCSFVHSHCKIYNETGMFAVCITSGLVVRLACQLYKSHLSTMD